MNFTEIMITGNYQNTLKDGYNEGNVEIDDPRIPQFSFVNDKGSIN